MRKLLGFLLLLSIFSLLIPITFAQVWYGEDAKLSKKRYIIELKGEPLLKIFNLKEIKKFGKKGNLKKLLDQTFQASELKAKHSQFKSFLLSKNIKPEISFKYLFNGFVVEATEREIEKIKKNPLVEKVYEEKNLTVLLNESVPLIKADKVWLLKDDQGRNVTGKNMTIAIIDTGVDYTHEDLGNCTESEFLDGNCSKVIGGYDFYNSDSNPMDDHGHGTHCAAIAAGNGSFKGVAPDASILAYKVCSSSGSCPTSYIIQAIENATLEGADVISISLGGTGDPEDAQSQAADNAVDNGVVVVIAAGNEGPGKETISSPGTAEKAITVGASDKSDSLASFSSRGPVIWDNKIMIKPDVLAPGVSICAAQWDNAWSNKVCAPNHVSLQGTSMATPHVAGAAALIRQMHPDWSPEEVKSALMATAKVLNYLPYEQGAGRIDVREAVNATLAMFPQSVAFGNVMGLDNVSKNITFKNIGNETYFFKIHKTNVTRSDSSSFDILSFSQDNFTLSPNENITITLTIILTDFDSTGEFYSYIKIENVNFSKNYTLPLFFKRYAILRVRMSSSLYPESELTPSFRVFNRNLSFQKSKTLFWSTSFDFEAHLDNYTVIAWGPSGTYSPNNFSYFLMKKVEVNQSIVEVNFTVEKDGEPYHLNSTSLDGRPLDRSVISLAFYYCKHYVQYPCTCDPNCTYSEKGWYGYLFQGYNVTVWISNFSKNDNVTVLVSYLGFPSAEDGYHEADPNKLDTKEWYKLRRNFGLSNELYFVVHMIQESNSSGTFSYNASKFKKFRKISSFFGSSPYYMEGYIAPAFATLVSFFTGRFIFIPENKTIYVYLEYPYSSFQIKNYISYINDVNLLDYQPITLVSTVSNITGIPIFEDWRGDAKAGKIFYFSSPMIPGYFVNSNTSISFAYDPDYRFIYGRNETTYHYKLSDASLKEPEVKIYRNGILYDQFNSSWTEGFNLPVSSANYTVHISIPLFYSAPNYTLVNSSFEIGGSDVNPPYIKDVILPPYFIINETSEIKILPEDDKNVSEVKAWFNDGEWKEINLNKTNDWYIGNLTVNTSVEKIDLKIMIKDNSSNTINYTFIPAILKAHNITFNASFNVSVSRKCNEVTFSGRVKDNETDEYLPFIKLHFYINGNFSGYEGTWEGDEGVGLEKGEFEYKFQVPCDYQHHQLNLTVKFDGSGRYPAKQETHTLNVDLGSPTVLLEDPQDNFLTSSSHVIFSCKAFDDLEIKSVSLYGNFSGTWSIFMTNSSGINDTVYHFNVSMDEGIFEWNCKACDSFDCSFNSTNRTILVDRTPPLINIISPLNKTYSSSTISIEYVVNDLSLDECWLFNGTSNVTLENCQNTSLTLPNGAYCFMIYANDSIGNLNYSSVCFTIKVTEGSEEEGGGNGGGTETSGGVAPGITGPVETIETENITERITKTLNYLNISNLNLQNETRKIKIDWEFVEEINVRGNVKNGKIQMNLLKEDEVEEKLTSNKTGKVKVFSYFSIDLNFKPIDFFIYFSVPLSWLKENQLNETSIHLWKFDREWKKLETEIIEKDDEIKYRARIPSFSLFAIAGEESVRYFNATNGTECMEFREDEIPEGWKIVKSCEEWRETLVKELGIKTLIPKKRENILWYLLLVFMFILIAFGFVKSMKSLESKKKETS